MVSPNARRVMLLCNWAMWVEAHGARFLRAYVMAPAVSRLRQSSINSWERRVNSRSD